jgi:pseudaminic acid synthase
MDSDITDIPPIQIGKHTIGPGHPVFIVAELSANHRQNFDEAVRLIEAAKEAGADAVKLQTYTPDTMTIDCDDERFRHGNDSLWEGQTLYELYQKAYMPWEWQPKLKKIANELGLELFSSAYDPSSVAFLESMDVPAYKISSFELIDLPLIRLAAKTGKPVILSTGMGTLDEIEQGVTAARSEGAQEIVLLKCASAYPADPSTLNLVTLQHLAATFNLPCGLSSTVDGPFSMSPQEFRKMVDDVRTMEKALGAVAYGPNHSEKESLSFRRSLYAVEDIKTGDPITDSNVRAIRPSGGLPPGDLEGLLGRRTQRAVRKGNPISWEVFHQL